MHCEHLPQWGLSLLSSHVWVQLHDHPIIGPQPASTIDLTTSALVFHWNRFVTRIGDPLSRENSRLNPASTLGCVVRVALAPTTWREIGRLRLTVPFS